MPYSVNVRALGFLAMTSAAVACGGDRPTPKGDTAAGCGGVIDSAPGAGAPTALRPFGTGTRAAPAAG